MYYVIALLSPLNCLTRYHFTGLGGMIPSRLAYRRLNPFVPFAFINSLFCGNLHLLVLLDGPLLITVLFKGSEPDL